MESRVFSLGHRRRRGSLELWHFKPPYLETDNLVEALNKATQKTPNEEDDFLKQLQKTQANISLWGLLMASHKHRQNQSNPSPYNHYFSRFECYDWVDK